jgi:hypothetical protein
MPKASRVYGNGTPEVFVLPLPIGFESAPTSAQNNYEIGQVVYTPKHAPTAFYLYAGGGIWALFASGTGDIVSILGTASQVTATVNAGVATLSLPAAIVAPGSLATTTTLTGGTGVTATTGNLTATNGNLVLGTAGNKISIATGTNGSAGTSGAMTAGSVVVATTAITANSLVFFTTHTLGTVTAPQAYYVSARTPGTSFTITSADATDTSTVDYLILN